MHCLIFCGFIRISISFYIYAEMDLPVLKIKTDKDVDLSFRNSSVFDRDNVFRSKDKNLSRSLEGSEESYSLLTMSRGSTAIIKEKSGLKKSSSTLEGESAEAPIALNKEADKKLCNILRKLKQTKEDACKVIDKEFKECLYQISLECESEIKSVTRVLIAFLKDIENKLKSIKMFEQEVNVLRKSWDEAVNDWRCDVDQVARKQNEKCKEMLSNYKNKLLHLRQLPHPVVDFHIRNFITDINNVIMGNERMFTETEYHLKLIFDNLVHDWLVHHSYQELMEAQNLLAAEKESMEQESQIKHEEAADPILTLVDWLIEHSKQPLPEFLMISKVVLYLNHLELCKKQVQGLNNETMYTVKTHIEKASSSIEEGCPEFEDFQTLWTDIIALLGEKVLDSNKFLCESIKIWNKFIKSLQSNEQFMTNSLNIYRMKHLKTLEGSEELLNISLDKMRQSKNMTLLIAINEQVGSLLTALEKTTSIHEEDISTVIRHFPTACYMLYDIYIAEMNVLRGETLPRGKQNIPIFPTDESVAEDIQESTLTDIKNCLVSTQNWLDGYKEITELLETEVLFFLGSMVETWVSHKKGEFEYWQKLEEQKIAQRRERIKNEIYEVRAAELSAHDKLIDRHIKGIDELIQEIKGIPSSFSEKVKLIDDDLQRVCLEYEHELKVLPSNAITCLSKLEKLIERESNKKIHLKGKAEAELERVTYWMHHSNQVFLKSVRLFGEGGNFSSEEAENLIKIIQKLKQYVSHSHNDVHKKLKAVPYTSRRKKAANISQFFVKVEELNSKQRLDNVMTNLKCALKREINNAKYYVKKLKMYSIHEPKYLEIGFWDNFKQELNHYCTYFELPRTSKKLEHESSSVYRGIYKEKERRAKKGKKKGDKKKKKINEDESHSDTCEKSVEDEDSDSDSVNVGSYMLDYPESGAAGIVQKAQTHPTLFYFTVFVESMSVDNFLCNTKTLMVNAFHEIKKTIYDFSKNSKSKKKGTMYCSDLIDQYTIKVRKYNLQCEHIWIEIIYELLCAFIGLQTEISRYTTKFFSKFLKNWNAYKNEYVNSYKKAINAEYKRILVKRENLQNELKTLHGYPGNKDLLESLLKRVIRLCQRENPRHKKHLIQFQEVLDYVQEEFQKVVDESFKNIEKVNSSIIENKTIANFIKQIANYMPQLKKKKNIKSDDEYLFFATNREGRVLESLDDSKESFNEMQGSNDISLFINAILTSIKNITGNQNLEEIKASSVKLIFPNIWMELNEKIHLFKKELDQYSGNEYAALQAKFKEETKTLQHWKLLWVHDVKKIKALYVIEPIFEQQVHD